MEPLNIVLCGLGGQGILFMTKVLAEASLAKGYHVLGAETHGMAQRGGSVVSHLRIGEAESSLVRTDSADVILALEEHEGYRNLPFLREGARIYVNARPGRFPKDDVKAYLETRGVAYRSAPAGDMAMAADAPMSTNLALLGFYSAFEDTPVTHDELRATIERMSPERFLKLNMTVFDAGYEAASGDGGPS